MVRETMLQWKQEDLREAMHAARRVAEVCEETLQTQQHQRVNSIMGQLSTWQSNCGVLQVC